MHVSGAEPKALNVLSIILTLSSLARPRPLNYLKKWYFGQFKVIRIYLVPRRFAKERFLVQVGLGPCCSLSHELRGLGCGACEAHLGTGQSRQRDLRGLAGFCPQCLKFLFWEMLSE